MEHLVRVAILLLLAIFTGAILWDRLRTMSEHRAHTTPTVHLLHMTIVEYADAERCEYRHNVTFTADEMAALLQLRHWYQAAYRTEVHHGN